MRCLLYHKSLLSGAGRFQRSVLGHTLARAEGVENAPEWVSTDEEKRLFSKEILLSEVPPEGIAPILVVDDDPIKRYTTRRTLERSGFVVAEARTGEEALQHVRQKPALVVLDINLPDLHGVEVCRRIKANPTTASVLVLHLSAHRTSSYDQARGLEAGADGYLTVPVESEVLVATVRALLRLAQAEEATRAAAWHWRVTFDAISDAICLLDANGAVLRCNRALETLLNQPGDALIGASLHALTQAALELPEESIPMGFPKTPDTQSAEVQTADGRWLRVLIEPARENGTFAGTVCILSDITGRKLLEGELNSAYLREKNIAETFQRSLLTLPSAEDFPGWDVEPFYLPAWNEAAVGGDSFDVFPLGEGKLALVVADACGKGLKAASRTAEVKYALRAFLWENPDPAQALFRLNNFVCRSQQQRGHDTDLFTVAALVVIELNSGRTRCSAAGAEPPLLLRASGEAVMLEEGGLPLGVLLNETYGGTETGMDAGDTLLLATDGITEARHGAHFLGYDGMVRVAQAARSSDSLSEMGQTILAHARAFARGDFHDDVCLLLARRQ